MREVQVGIRELKNRLSQYLSKVKKGQTIVITERGKPIGRIIPGGLPIEERIKAAVDAGLVEWNGKVLDPCKPVARNRGERQVSDILVEMRE